MSTTEIPKFNPNNSNSAYEDAEGHALAEQEADKNRSEYSDEDNRNFALNMFGPELQRFLDDGEATDRIPVVSIDSTTEIPVKNPHFLQAIEEDDRRHAEKQALAEENKFRFSKALKAVGRRAIGSLNERTPKSSESDVEVSHEEHTNTGEKPGFLERFKNMRENRIKKRASALEKKLARIDAKRELQKKQRKLNADWDEAELENEYRDDWDEAHKVNATYKEEVEAHAINDAIDQAAYEAKLQEKRDAIYNAARLKSNKKIDRVIKKSEKIHAKADRKAEAVDEPSRFARIRARVAQAVQVISRQ